MATSTIEAILGRRRFRRSDLCAVGLLLAWSLGACVEANPPAVDYGTVIVVEPTQMAGENSGAGAVIGAVAGGVVGAQFGSGVGQALATLGGVIVGAEAGTVTETSLQNSTALRYTLKLADGRVVTIVQHRNKSDPVLDPGQPVKLVTVGREQHVLPTDRAASPRN